jgi:hypothetical protein
MPGLNADQLRKRSDLAWSRKEPWRALYDEAYEYALPQRNLYDGSWESGTRGQNKGLRIFDSTAVHSTQRFANRLQSGLFPPDKRWMELQPGTDIPDDRNMEVREALQLFTERFFAILRQTNFDLAMGEFLLDLCVGTAGMMVQKGDDDQKIKFTSVPSFLFAFEEGPDGNAQNVYRKMKMPVENIQRVWPDAELDEALERMLEDTPTDSVNLREGTIFNVAEKKWGYYVWHQLNEDESGILVDRTIKRSPWVISRFLKVSGEIFGRGPIISALADIKTLNKAIELLLKNASINIAGVYTAIDDGVLNPQTIRIVPGAVIPVARNGGPQGPSLQPLPRSGDLQLSQLVINDLRLQIKKTLLDDSLPPDNMSARSATEIVERMRDLAINLGSSYGRMIHEAMVPLVKLVLAEMGDQGIIDLPLKVDGLEVQIVPVSPLAQAQNLDEVQNVLQWLGVASQLGPVGLATADMENISDWVADQLGVPVSLRTGPEERQAASEAGAAFLQNQAQQQAVPVDPGQPPPGAQVP